MSTLYRRAKPLLGTIVEITVPRSARAESAVKKAFAQVQKVHDLLSAHEPASDLSRLNCHPEVWLPIHPITLRVLRLARSFTLKSDGLFNCTLGGKLVKRGILPRHRIGKILDAGEAADLMLHRGKAKLRRPVWITLDGIAKGYAVDLAIECLKKEGMPFGWVNAGGDLRVYGRISLPVQQRNARGRLQSLANLKNLALATSCVFSRPRSDYPGWIVSDLGQPKRGAWSVVAKEAWRADALTKVACLAPPGRRKSLVEALGGKCVSC